MGHPLSTISAHAHVLTQHSLDQIPQLPHKLQALYEPLKLKLMFSTFPNEVQLTQENRCEYRYLPDYIDQFHLVTIPCGLKYIPLEEQDNQYTSSLLLRNMTNNLQSCTCSIPLLGSSQ